MPFFEWQSPWDSAYEKAKLGEYNKAIFGVVWTKNVLIADILNFPHEIFEVSDSNAALPLNSSSVLWLLKPMEKCISFLFPVELTTNEWF